MTYDNRYRIMQNKLAATSTIAQYDYGHDPAGNITSIANALDAGYDRTFAYDDLNSLVTADTGANLWRTGSYSYDAMGNVLSLRLGEVIRPPEPGDQSRLRSRSDVSTLPLGRVTTFAYSGTTPKVATVTNNDLERPVTYDDAGNEISYAIQRTYSSRNLLSSVIEPLEGMTHRIDYGYDGRGLRVRRSEPPTAGGNSTRYFIYSPELQLLPVTNDDTPNPWLRGPRVNAVSPSIRTEILWFGGRPTAQVTGGTTLAYTFTDHLGTPILQTSAGPAPTVTWRAEHEPFGNVYEMRVGSRTDQPLRFPGQEVAMTLEGQEENYNIFRWYRSGWGRYTQADTDEITRLFQPYGYALQQPVNNTDPLGLSAASAVLQTCEVVLSTGLSVAASAGAIGIGLLFSATETSRDADLSDVYPAVSCRDCTKTKEEECKESCVKAYEFRYDECSRRYHGNAYQQAKCYERIAEVLEDCLLGCTESHGGH